MATKKRVKRYNGEDESMVDQDAADQEATSMMKRGIPDQTEEEAANEAEMMSSMMRKRAMEEGERDEKALPAGYKVEAEAPVMRKKAMPKPAVFSNEGRSSKAPAYSNEGRGSTPKKSAEETRDEKVRNAYRAAGDELKAMFSKMAPTAAEYNAARIAMKPKFRASQGYANGGSASSRADGIASKGKTRGKIC